MAAPQLALRQRFGIGCNKINKCLAFLGLTFSHDSNQNDNTAAAVDCCHGGSADGAPRLCRLDK